MEHLTAFALGTARRIGAAADWASAADRLRRGGLSLVVPAAIGALAAFAVAPPHAARAGGGPDDAVLIVDPTRDDSLYLGNYYRDTRGIPDRNVLYMPPGAGDYGAFTELRLPALLGTMATRGIDDHVDYVIVAPSSTFYVSAADLITSDACSEPVRRLSISAAYGLAPIADEIKGGELRSTDSNRYFGINDSAIAFSSRATWLGGSPGEGGDARRYVIGFLLGYTGERGNTVAELKDMIDRSVAADGSRPDGTFYLMRSPDRTRSAVRDFHFGRVTESLTNLGADAEEIEGVLPEGRHDVLGVITGAAGPDIDAADMTLEPGAYADHLTSYAGAFDVGGQTKLSRWIGKGASGSNGTVEEPCTYTLGGTTGKFPHPRVLVYYRQGLSLGEALFRSMQFTPFQGLLYGDPLTRPYASFPQVGLGGLPEGPATGELTLWPLAMPVASGSPIAEIALFVDGVRQQVVATGGRFLLDTTRLADGFHDLSVVAYDDTPVRTQGRWSGTLEVDNRGRSVEASADPEAGGLVDTFTVTARASGAAARELRLMQGSRVLAAGTGDEVQFALPGRLLGAGPVELTVVAEFEDGGIALSAPARVDIAYDESAPPSPPGPSGPVAYSYHTDVIPGRPVLVDLPGTDADGDRLSPLIDGEPSQGEVHKDAAAALLTSRVDAAGEDELVFRVTDGERTSNTATVTIRYCDVPRLEAEPVSAEVCLRSPVALSVAATGTDLDYRWLRDGQPIAGANASRLTFTMGPWDEGEYSVIVGHNCGQVRTSVTSAAAMITVRRDGTCRETAFLPFVQRAGAIATHGRQSVNNQVAAMAPRLAQAPSASYVPFAARRQDVARLPIPLTAPPSPTPTSTPTATDTPTVTPTPTATPILCDSLATRLRVSGVDVSPANVRLVTRQGQWNPHSPIMLATLPDGRARAAWTDDDRTIHVTPLDENDERLEADWTTMEGEVRGLVALEDGTALLVADEPHMSFVTLDRAGEATVTKRLVGERPQTEVDSKWVDAWGHEGRLVWSGTEFGAYFGHTQYFGASRGKHQGDLFWLLDAAGDRLDVGTDWDWGCSHSLDLRLAHNGTRYGGVCLSDCYRSKAFMFHARSVIRSEPSGDCSGHSTARLGGLVPLENGFAMTFASREGRSSSDIGFVTISNDGVIGKLKWLTDTPEDEDAPHLGPYGPGLLAGWKSGDATLLAELDTDGNVKEGPEEVSVQFGERDDFAGHANGDAAWAYSWGTTRQLKIVRVHYCEK